MVYKAIMDIGEYKKGDFVPEDKAETWMKMYKESPVVKVVVEKPIVEEKKEIKKHVPAKRKAVKK